MNTVLYLVRGYPGSGKSHTAKELAKTENLVHFEADDFFMFHGRYVFSPDKLAAAHSDCLCKTMRALHAGQSVVVSNTFIDQWEINPYLEAAKLTDSPVFVRESDAEWKDDIRLCHWYCAHDVPRYVLRSMEARWVPTSELEGL